MQSKGIELLSGLAWMTLCAIAYRFSGVAGEYYGFAIAMVATGLGLVVAIATACNFAAMLGSILWRLLVVIMKSGSTLLTPITALMPRNRIVAATIGLIVSRPVLWGLRLVFGGMFLKIVLPISILAVIALAVPRLLFSMLPQNEEALKFLELWDYLTFSFPGIG